jgi:stearoyl-CoA desaturase (delta-9 desaturase)
MITFIYGYLFYYIAALIGISIGYHRYFTHRSFETSVALEIAMLFFGLICGGRSALTWAGVHRMHHVKSDTEQDPHSPIYKGVWNVLSSRWHVEYIPKKHIVDLLKNPRIVFFHRYRKHIHLAYASIIALLGGINLFIIFVFMPFILSWVGFGLLNWLAHRSGTPADIPILNIIAPGEGWHKYHHDNPRSYKLHKLDIAGILIERFFIKPKFSSKD